MALPPDDKSRKELPVFTGPLMYFPDAIAEVARVCKIGNDQHNPGEPLHWARGKSMDQMNTALRHMMDHGTGTVKDVDGTYHMAKAVWRCLAELQLTIEHTREAAKEDAAIDERYGPPMCLVCAKPCEQGAHDMCGKHDPLRGMGLIDRMTARERDVVKDLRPGALVKAIAPTGIVTEGMITTTRYHGDRDVLETQYYVTFIEPKCADWYSGHQLEVML